MLKLLNFFHKSYQNLNIIEVSQDNLLHNYSYLCSLNNKIKIAPVLKSNGYGHGIIHVAKILDPMMAPFFCVDSLFEAYKLQKAHIKTKILIMGYTNPVNLRIKKLPFAFAVYDLNTVKTLNQFQSGCSVHIFVDSGMHREGIRIEELPQFLAAVKQLPNIKIEGLMSHLASTNGLTDRIFQEQIKNFKKAITIFAQYKIKLKWRHIAASGALTNQEICQIIAQVSNLSRAGIALYGLSDDNNLKPTLSLKTHIVQIKTLKKGEKTGYDGTYVAHKDMVIGILPIGYNDGVDRRLSNKGSILVEGIRCPILGRISMNITTIDLSGAANPQVGQEAAVYSGNRSVANSISNCASLCHTIPYDLLVGLSESTKRIVV